MGKKEGCEIWRDLVLHPPKRWNLFWHNIGAAVSRPRLQKLIRYNAQMKKNTIDAKNTTQEAVKTGPGRPQKNEPGMVRVNVQVTVEDHKKLKIYCAQTGTTITDLVRKLIGDLPV